MIRVLLYGGSFDPIHLGHLIVSRHVAEQLGVPQVVLLPAPMPPHKQGRTLAPGVERLALCRLAVGADPQFAVSDWELRQSGPSYTLRTVTHWRESSGLGADELGWLIGMDSLRELHTWHRVAELVDACTIVTASRPGHTPGDLGWLQPTLTAGQIERLRRYIVAGPLIDIAATDIRRRVAAGQSVRYLVPEQVARQIRERGLYRPAAE